MMNYPMTALPIPITIQTSAEAGHPLSDFQIKMIQGFAEAMARHNAVKNLTRIPLGLSALCGECFDVAFLARGRCSGHWLWSRVSFVSFGGGSA
jgi:hypothetical protein